MGDARLERAALSCWGLDLPTFLCWCVRNDVENYSKDRHTDLEFVLDVQLHGCTWVCCWWRAHHMARRQPMLWYSSMMCGVLAFLVQLCSTFSCRSQHI